MIILSFDANLLDKSRFKVVTKKNGQKATYVELVLFETPNSDYGDYLIKQQVTKEERAARKEMPILGNARIWEKGQQRRQADTGTPGTEADKPQTDDVPF